MEKDTKEKFTCPHCKKTGEKMSYFFICGWLEEVGMFCSLFKEE